MDVIGRLHESLDLRMPPEAVAGLILQVPDTGLLPAQRRVLERAAGRLGLAQYSSMSDDFARPVPAEHKVQVLLQLLGKDVSEQAKAQMAGDPWQLAGQLQMVAPFVGWDPTVDFAGRLNRKQLSEAGTGLSKRQYNRLLRHIERTRKRAERMKTQVLLRQLVVVGRSGLAYSITVDEMRADPVGACFVAYWAAQRNRRREFTLDGRDNPFDTIAEMLLSRCRADAGTDWWMIARVYPDPAVVARLSDLRQGELLGQWSAFMRLAAGMLGDLYAAWPSVEVDPAVPDRAWQNRPALMPSRQARGARSYKVVDLETMIVRRGVDSSTWNTVAQAYNAARAGWMNCLAATGALGLLDVFCPGKAMRLMAGDLAAVHCAGGGGPDPQTRVWAALPPPWELFADDQRGPGIGRSAVEWACQAVGVNAQAKGWTAPRPTGAVADWKPTPELVHGVEVADPLWAGLLRKAGVFSGKPGHPDAGPLRAAYADEQATA